VWSEIVTRVGHTGSEPFDQHHGWYRAWRGLAGAVVYKAKRKGWKPSEHILFPQEMKRSLLTLLCCQQRLENRNTATGPLVTEQTADGKRDYDGLITWWCWFHDRCIYVCGWKLLCEYWCIGFEVRRVLTSCYLLTWYQPHVHSSPVCSSKPPRRIVPLPKYVIYYIMEFMVSVMVSSRSWSIVTFVLL
jgi:hypothetical protein